MITIKSVNPVGETTISQLFKNQLQSLTENHFPGTLGIKSGTEEDEDEDSVTTTWEFPTYWALRVFIERVLISAFPREISHYSGDDDYFDYHPALVEEVFSFFGSLTEALPYSELSKLADINNPDFDEYYQVSQLIDSIQMAITIFNAIVKANRELGRAEEIPHDRFFEALNDKGPLLPEYK